MTVYPPVVVVAGWGVPASLVEPVFDGWPAPVVPVSLDTMASDPGTDPCRWLDGLRPALPDRALWVGWSLGGQLAMEMARCYPAYVAGVVTLCSAPSFVARPGWPEGMPDGRMQAFRRSLEADPVKQWRRFLRMQVLGDVDERQALRQLMPLLEAGPRISLAVLSATLEWLEQLDGREFWNRCWLPRLHLVGDRDSVCRWRGAGLNEAPEDARPRVLPGMAHWPGGFHRRQVRALIERFVTSREIQ